jgi:hypothetical protein
MAADEDQLALVAERRTPNASLAVARLNAHHRYVTLGA